MVSNMLQQFTGYFTVAFLIIQPIFVLQNAIGNSLLSEGGRRQHQYGSEVRRATAFSLTLVLMAVAFGIVLAPSLLQFFGSSYSAHGTSLLRVLLVSTIPGTVNAIYQTKCRIDGRMRPMLYFFVTYTILSLGCTVPLIHYFRLAGIGMALLIGHGVPAIWTSRSVFDALRGKLESSDNSGPRK
jgi:O-antigen/teichoic acid export membrane protein